MTGSPDPAAEDIWRPSPSPVLLHQPEAQLVGLIVLTSIVFLAFPGIDLWFSGLFFATGGFLVTHLQAFVAVRDFHRDLTAIVVIVGLLVLLIKLLWPRRKSLLRPRDVYFILLTLAVGPGVITNLVFKNNWGRPRPFTVDVFGGPNPFVGIWQISDYCKSNCSFISGEASSAAWALTLAVLVPPRWRKAALTGLAIYAVTISLNRIAFGAHFLSDVLFAWWVTLLVVMLFYRLLYVSPPARITNQRMEEDLTRSGLQMRQGLAMLVDRVRGKGSDDAPPPADSDRS